MASGPPKRLLYDRIHVSRLALHVLHIEPLPGSRSRTTSNIVRKPLSPPGDWEPRVSSGSERS